MYEISCENKRFDTGGNLCAHVSTTIKQCCHPDMDRTDRSAVGGFGERGCSRLSGAMHTDACGHVVLKVGDVMSKTTVFSSTSVSKQ